MLSPLLPSHTAGDAIDAQPGSSYLFSSFEFFLPEVLREIHDEWQHESLDGLYPEVFRKTGEHEIEFIGLAMFLSDQTLTPIHLRLQLSSNHDHVSWVALKLGERIDGKFHREAYSKSRTTGAMLCVAKRVDSIDWFYDLSYGERKI